MPIKSYRDLEAWQVGMDKAYIHFVTMALASLAEAKTQIELARRLRFARRRKSND
jgi:four helix bundle protein